MEVLSSTALDAIVQSGDLKGLWDILLNRLDLSEDPLILADCTVVLEHLLRCPSRQKLWGPNLDSNHFTLKCVEAVKDLLRGRITGNNGKMIAIGT